MSDISVPIEFQQAVLDSKLYPMNTIYKTIDAGSKYLKKAERGLCEREDDLFDNNESSWEICIRDLDTECGKDVDKYNVHSYEKLSGWLGIELLPTTHGSSITMGKKDPRCRFINIYGMHSMSKLRLTRAMLTKILTFHQVMPAFLEFIYVFGQQDDSADLHFTGFREQVILTDPPDGLIIPKLGRSGKHYQICFNLKGVALKSKNKDDFTLDDWSIRPAAFHHQFDVSNGNTLWLVVKGNQEIQDRFKDLTGKDARAQDKCFDSVEKSFRSSLSAHLLYCYWAMEDWRWCISWLEKAVDKKHRMAVLGPSGVGHAHKTYTPADIQDLQIWEERTRQVIMALESNVDIMSSLVAFYRRLTRDKNFPLRKTCSLDVCSFGNQVQNITADLKMQIKRAEFLIRTISDRRQLVIQHLQSQSAHRAERLGRSMEQEQIFMLVITIVTLIFLPATFVSTFFSTDIIKYQGSESPEGSFSATAMSRWLEVTIPLTAVTCGVAWWARRWKLTKRRENELGLERRKTHWKLICPFSSSITVLPFHEKAPLETKDSFL
ncbi:uncharacterized protein GGS22DRAFT_152260 [Annulohypoxylon maeteangense]|uniref:uncharacterized protein n=1 Tax=Annulohypoxylon maeteangense TaxID=1927788 RepID=UPI00200732D2|nr:uncharacterized protein GGS22DRAFT_152260 [Annulohypoxylon maeteangense]KAI0888744.1 hypothetical protein GGS22DRAFT_152260 [Annulohypoxylon maeteangense]